MFSFIGHLHPVLVHLPIGILLLACLFQLLSAMDKYMHLKHAIGITLFWGMVSAALSCVTGWLLSGSGDYDEVLVNRHQWLGISVAVVSLLYYLLFSNNIVQKYTWVMPAGLIVLIAITGHLGGSLTHGSDYLTSAFSHADNDTAVEMKARPISDVQEAVLYTDIIQPMLQAKCYSCHGTNKQKGKLRMDQPDWLLKGGKDGIVINPGKADESELIKRLVLEKSDEHHMPPKEKPQLTDKEVVLLHWWIESGASFTKKTKELAQAEKMKPILLSLQNTSIELKEPTDVPVEIVEKADEKAIQQLKDKGIVVIPVAAGSNYLSVSFVTATHAGNEEVQLLRPLRKQLVWLKLSDTRITDSACAILAQCGQLTRLQLDSTGITDKGLANLAGLSQLQLLNLVGTRVTVNGFLSLRGLKALKSVYVYKTGSKGILWANLKKEFPAVKIDTGGYIVPLFETDTMLVKPPKGVKEN